MPVSPTIPLAIIEFRVWWWGPWSIYNLIYTREEIQGSSFVLLSVGIQFFTYHLLKMLFFPSTAFFPLWENKAGGCRCMGQSLCPLLYCIEVQVWFCLFFEVVYWGFYFANTITRNWACGYLEIALEVPRLQTLGRKWSDRNSNLNWCMIAELGCPALGGQTKLWANGRRGCQLQRPALGQPRAAG